MSAGKGDKNRVRKLQQFQNNYDEINWTKKDIKEPSITEFVFTWFDGHEEVRYRRDYNSKDAREMILSIEKLRQHTPDSPYSYRHV